MVRGDEGAHTAQQRRRLPCPGCALPSPTPPTHPHGPPAALWAGRRARAAAGRRTRGSPGCSRPSHRCTPRRRSGCRRTAARQTGGRGAAGAGSRGREAGGEHERCSGAWCCQPPAALLPRPPARPHVANGAVIGACDPGRRLHPHGARLNHKRGPAGGGARGGCQHKGGAQAGRAAAAAAHGGAAAEAVGLSGSGLSPRPASCVAESAWVCRTSTTGCGHGCRRARAAPEAGTESGRCPAVAVMPMQPAAPTNLSSWRRSRPLTSPPDGPARDHPAITARAAVSKLHQQRWWLAQQQKNSTLRDAVQPRLAAARAPQPQKVRACMGGPAEGWGWLGNSRVQR